MKLLYEKLGYWTESTLLDRWNDSVSIHGNKEFVSDDNGNRYTYLQLDSAADSMAAYLEQVGIGSKDVVSFQIPPRSEFVVLLIACIKIGAVPAPLGMCFVDDELKDLLNLLKSKLHASVSKYRSTERIGMITQIMPEVPSLSSLVFLCTSDDDE